MSSKEQSCSRLPHARFHPLVGRILATALERDLDAGGIVNAQFRRTGGGNPPLSQFPGGHGEIEDESVGLPLKWLQGI
jgi:hypothetical protein